MSILDLFCSVDAFWRQFEPLWEQQHVARGRRRRRATRLHPSEIMTILILFQQSGYRTFKGFYTQHVQTQLRGIPAAGQLHPLRGPHPARAAAARGLSAHATGKLHGHQLRRRHLAERLS